MRAISSPPPSNTKKYDMTQCSDPPLRELLMPLLSPDLIHVVVYCFSPNVFSIHFLCNTHSSKKVQRDCSIYFLLYFTKHYGGSTTHSNYTMLQLVKHSLKINVAAFTKNVKVYQTTRAVKQKFIFLLFNLFLCTFNKQ